MKWSEVRCRTGVVTVVTGSITESSERDGVEGRDYRQ